MSGEKRMMSLASVLLAVSLHAPAQAREDPLTARPTNVPRFQKAHFTKTSGDRDGAFHFRAGSYQLELSHPDDRKNPKVWDSALTIKHRQTGAHCSSEPLLVRNVYLSEPVGAVLVVSYSGLLTWLHFLNINSCKPVVEPIKTPTEGVEVASGRIAVLPGCECASPEEACSCSSGQVLLLDADGRPKLLEKESLELTRRELGVAFLGRRKIRHLKK